MNKLEYVESLKKAIKKLEEKNKLLEIINSNRLEIINNMQISAKNEGYEWKSKEWIKKGGGNMKR